MVLFDLAQPHALYGVTEYDDGVYLASALRLIAGHLPYRDYAFVQPPGIALVLTPVALIAHVTGTRTALAVARILTAVVVGVNAGLCAALVRHRGVAAALVAGGVLALYPPAFWAVHTAMLEPYLDFFTLLGANLAFSRGVPARRARLIAAGVCFGISGSIKVWGLIGAVVLCICLCREIRRALTFGLGTLAGLIVTCGPFFVAAPSAFWHQVVTSQLQREAIARTTVTERLFNLAGLHGLNFSVAPANSGSVGLIVLVLAAVLVIGGLLLPVGRRGPSALESFVVLGAICAAGAVFVPVEFYTHYVFYPALFFAAALGLSIGRIGEGALAVLGSLGGRVRRAGPRILGTAALAGAIAIAAAAVVGETTYVSSHSLHIGDPGETIAAHVPKGACTVSDAEILLIVANRVSESPSCPMIIDATGTWLAADPSHPVLTTGSHPHLAAEWKGWFNQADYVVLSDLHPFRIPWTTALYADLHANFAPMALHGGIVWTRRNLAG
jgi:alpha-1,2-mannosyltransferase